MFDITKSMEKEKTKILVADDELGWRDLLSLELLSKDCKVITASNAEEAIDVKMAVLISEGSTAF